MITSQSLFFRVLRYKQKKLTQANLSIKPVYLHHRLLEVQRISIPISAAESLFEDTLLSPVVGTRCCH